MNKSNFDWMKCPKCNKTEHMSYIGGSVFEILGLSIIGEVVIWILAGIFLIFFSMLKFESAYGIAILILFIIAIFNGDKLPWFLCDNCNKWYSLKGLKEEYEKSLKHRSSSIDGAS